MRFVLILLSFSAINLFAQQNKNDSLVNDIKGDWMRCQANNSSAFYSLREDTVTLFKDNDCSSQKKQTSWYYLRDDSILVYGTSPYDSLNHDGVYERTVPSHTFWYLDNAKKNLIITDFNKTIMNYEITFFDKKIMKLKLIKNN